MTFPPPSFSIVESFPPIKNLGAKYNMSLADAAVRLNAGPITGRWAASGQATIPAGDAEIAVDNAEITATSVVIAQYLGAAQDATLQAILRVTLTPGVGFTIVGDANADADVLVAWAILAY